VGRAMKGMMAPVYEEVIIGRAEVRDAFQIRKIGMVAGCYMRTGEAQRNSFARLIRGSKLIHEGKVTSLKHIQDNVRTIKTGFEFGVNIGEWNDYQAGDIIEFYINKRVEF
jgi:translation initiation factor IF-2